MRTSIAVSEDHPRVPSRSSWLLVEMTYGPGALLLLGMLARKTKAAVRPRKRRTRTFWVAV
jgi:hypothetical protein